MNRNQYIRKDQRTNMYNLHNDKQLWISIVKYINIH